MKVISLILAVTLLSSCAVVKQNGYCQSKRYKLKKLKLIEKNNSLSKTPEETIVKPEEAITLNGISKVEIPLLDSLCFSSHLRASPLPVPRSKPTASRILKSDSLVANRELIKHPYVKVGGQISVISLLFFFASLLLGAFSTVIGTITVSLSIAVFITAIVFLFIAEKETKENPEVYKGKGNATTIIAALLTIAVLILGIIYFINQIFF